MMFFCLLLVTVFVFFALIFLPMKMLLNNESTQFYIFLFHGS